MSKATGWGTACIILTVRGGIWEAKCEEERRESSVRKSRCCGERYVLEEKWSQNDALWDTKRNRDSQMKNNQEHVESC